MSQLIRSTRPLRTFEDHEDRIYAVTVFPDNRQIVTASNDKTLRLWDLKTGAVWKKMEGHSSSVWALAVSRDGKLIASGDRGGNLIIWHGGTGESLTQPIEVSLKWITSLHFSPDGTVLAASSSDHTTKFWCTKTWQMQGGPIDCGLIHCVRYSPSGELLAIATTEDIQIYNPGTRERVASFDSKGRDIAYNLSLAWTPDGTRLLTGGNSDDPTIREWDTTNWRQVGDPWKGHTRHIYAIDIHPTGALVASASNDNHVRLWRLSNRRTIAIFQHSSFPTCVTFSADGKHIFSGGVDNKISEWAVPKDAHSKILTVTLARDACITGDLSTAEELLTQEIDTDANGYTSYAHRSFIMARKRAWDHALQDAIKSISIEPSLTGYISKGIALCGKGHVQEARIAFDVASLFTDQDPVTNHFLLLINAIALFNAGQHEEAILFIKELSAVDPNADLLGCRVVEKYLHVQLGTKASDGARHDDAADYFTAAVNVALSSKFIHLIYEDLVMLFGWDLHSLCLTAHRKRCQALLSAGKPDEALKAHQYMIDVIDETVKASCHDWSNEFKEQCNTLAAYNVEIHDQDDYNTGPSFFYGTHQHFQTPQSRHQQRPGRLERLRLAMARTPRSVPTSALPTTSPPAAAPTTIIARLVNLVPWRSDHAGTPVVDVPFAQGRHRYAAADAPGSEHSLIRDEDYHGSPTPDPNSQQQQQVDAGEHGGGRSRRCC